VRLQARFLLVSAQKKDVIITDKKITLCGLHVYYFCRFYDFVVPVNLSFLAPELKAVNREPQYIEAVK
jgi:hypothetical protein